MDLLSLAETLARTGLSRRTFFRVRERGEFPLPVRIAANARLVVWRADDVDAWCEQNMKPCIQRDP